MKMLIYQAKANLDEKSLVGNITHLLDLKIRKMLKEGVFGKQDFTFHSGPGFKCY